MEAVLSVISPELSLLNPATLAIATITTMTSLYLYFVDPSVIIQTYFKVALRFCGLKSKTILSRDGEFQFSYGEKGQPIKGQASMVFLHGFTADNFMWTSIIQNIPVQAHVVAIDLPGHGFTSSPHPGEDISFKGQTKRVKEFVDLVGLSKQPFILVGLSMGGALAGVFAAEHPDLVAAVSLTCPSMKTPRDSRMIEENRDSVLGTGGLLTLENCPIMPQTPEKLQQMLEITHYKNETKYPQQILKGVLKIRKQKNDFHLRLANVLISEESTNMLEDNLHRIMCPTQVCWGKQDWVVDLSGLDVIRDKAPNVQSVKVFDECGHAVNLDQPRNYAVELLSFWKAHSHVQEFES